VTQLTALCQLTSRPYRTFIFILADWRFALAKAGQVINSVPT